MTDLRIKTQKTIIVLLVFISVWTFYSFLSCRQKQTAQADQFINRLIPRPQKIDVAASARMNAGEIYLNLPQIDHPLISTAADLLRAYARGSEGFELRLVLASGDCPQEIRTALAGLPNRDQAYAIQPFAGKEKGKGLFLAAETPLGLLYAARTLRRLLGLPPAATTQKIAVPKVTVLDWPDLAERGLWGGNAAQDLAWMAERKLNVVEVHARLGFNEDGSPRAELDLAMLAEAQRLGIKIVPIILHLEQLAGTGLFKFHPDVAAKPDPGKPLPTDFTPGVCFSQPKTIELLAGWMKILLSYPGISEVDVWLSEMEGGCFCPDCRGKNPFVLESQGVIKAFEKVRPLYPGASLRLLLTQASHDSNDRVLAAVRPETKAIYYDGGKTYDSSHRPMIYPLLEEYARSGRWLGVYPQLTNSWRTVFPFTGSQFIRTRMQEFVSKGLSGVIGYATPSNRYYEFNITAAAEWSWNSRGRTEREFAAACAERRGLPDPEKYAAWAEAIGPVGWKLAGSRAVEKFIFGAGRLAFENGVIKSGGFAETLETLRFGGEMLEEFGDEKDFRENLEQAARALKLAEEMGDPAAELESRSVLSLMEFFFSLKKVAEQVSAPDAASSKREDLAASLGKMDRAAEELTRSIFSWGKLVNPAPRNHLPSRFRDSVDFPAAAAETAWRLALPRGLKDPSPERRSRPVLEWTEKDFAVSADAAFWVDITDFLDGPGEYDITLHFLDGASGVATRAVFLFLGESPRNAVALDEDRWNFRIGRWDRYADYWISFSRDQAAAAGAMDRFWVKIDLSGPDLSLPAGRRTTHGLAALRKSWRQ